MTGTITPEQARAVLAAVAGGMESEPYGAGYVVIEIRKGKIRRIYSGQSWPVPPETTPPPAPPRGAERGE